MTLRVREAKTSDFEAYHAHLQRHGAESGVDGDFIFTPFEGVQVKPLAELQHARTVDWLLEVTQPGWRRSWFLTDDQSVFGEVQLVHMPATPTCLHRAVLMMGIERAQRGRGWGSQLMRAAIDWSKKQPSLDWLQLYVFESNAPAIALYKKFGFVETGRTVDAFRVYGQSINDISMSLRL